MGAPWTDDERAYILRHISDMGYAEIAEHLGKTPEGVRYQISTMRRQGAEIPRKPTVYPATYRKPTEDVRPLRIVDGYDTVPWWCRQSTRCQTLHVSL